MPILSGVFTLLQESRNAITSRSENAYVGGDIYNYIINGTYFAGFFAFSGAMYDCARICVVLVVRIFSSVPENGETKEVEARPASMECWVTAGRMKGNRRQKSPHRMQDR